MRRLRIHWTRRNLLLAGEVVLLVVLVGVAVALAIHIPGQPPVTVDGVQWTIAQGTNSTTGMPWFSYLGNDSGRSNGFPVEVATGTILNVTLILTNEDTADHTIYTASGNTPIKILGENPPFPMLAYHEDFTVAVEIQILATSGSTIWVEITLDALG